MGRHLSMRRMRRGRCARRALVHVLLLAALALPGCEEGVGGPAPGAVAPAGGVSSPSREGAALATGLAACVTTTGVANRLVTEISCTSAGIDSLAGIEAYPALQRLELTGSNISDLAPLAGLAELKSVNLAANRISDIGPLAALGGLTDLTLSGNRIGDLAPLADLTGLVSLDLTSNRIGGVDDLAGLTGLRYLKLDGNGINDVSPLAHLTNLTFLNLSLNAVTLGVRHLAALTQARSIVLPGNDGIACSDLDALDDALGAGVVSRPGACLPY